MVWNHIWSQCHFIKGGKYHKCWLLWSAEIHPPVCARVCADIEEKGVRMKLTVIDTPGFGDQINNENWYVVKILHYVGWITLFPQNPLHWSCLVGSPSWSSLMTSMRRTCRRRSISTGRKGFQTPESTVAFTSSPLLDTGKCTLK